MNKHNKVLVIAAHADDETLGCGGTIVRHTHNGDKVTVLIMTDGVSSRIGGVSKEIKNRVNSLHNAMKVLGVDDIRSLSFPDNQMDSIPLLSVTKEIEHIISEVKPTIVYTHYAHDLNIDHRITNNAVMTACRPQPNSSVMKLLTFEVLSSTEWNSQSTPSFCPNYFIDISEYWLQKLKALECYESEMRAPPHSRSYQNLEALAKFRGSSVGLDKAESFVIERIIDKR